MQDMLTVFLGVLPQIFIYLRTDVKSHKHYAILYACMEKFPFGNIFAHIKTVNIFYDYFGVYNSEDVQLFSIFFLLTIIL